MHCFWAAVMSALLKRAESSCSRMRFSRNCEAARRAAAPGLFRPVLGAPWESTERGHLLLLNRHTLELLDTVGHIAKDGFANLRTAGHEIPERFFVELGETAVAHGS